MIKRIAMWKLKDSSVMSEMEGKLLSMKHNVPSLLDIEVGKNISKSGAAFDIVFIGTFRDLDSLREFEDDKFHKGVSSWVSSQREVRHVVDYEVNA